MTLIRTIYVHVLCRIFHSMHILFFILTIYVVSWENLLVGRILLLIWMSFYSKMCWLGLNFCQVFFRSS